LLDEIKLINENLIKENKLLGESLLKKNELCENISTINTNLIINKDSIIESLSIQIKNKNDIIDNLLKEKKTNIIKQQHLDNYKRIQQIKKQGVVSSISSFSSTSIKNENVFENPYG
jgi:hypothetical protein